MVKKWKSCKWYFCTIMGEACLTDEMSVPEPPDCDDCPVYHDWKNEKAKAPTTEHEKEKQAKERE